MTCPTIDTTQLHVLINELKHISKSTTTIDKKQEIMNCIHRSTVGKQLIDLVYHQLKTKHLISSNVEVVDKWIEILHNEDELIQLSYLVHYKQYSTAYRLYIAIILVVLNIIGLFLFNQSYEVASIIGFVDLAVCLV